MNLPLGFLLNNGGKLGGLPLNKTKVVYRDKATKFMSNKYQLSADEAVDDFTGLPLGEGFITLRTSAGNRVLFNSPAEANQYRLANPGAFAATPDGSGSFNEADQNPTTT